MEFVDKLKGFLTQPKKAFKKEQKTNIKEALKYGFFGLVILGILTVVIMLIAGPSIISAMLVTTTFTGATAIAVFIGIIVLGFICLLICSAWIHLWAYIFGARQGIGNTVKTIFFAYSPAYILGWIPIVSFFAKIWYLVLIVIGLTQLQKLSTGKAIGALVIAIVIPLIILVALVLLAISLLGPQFLAAMEELGELS